MKILYTILLATTLHASPDWSHIIEHLDEYPCTPIPGGASNINYHLTIDGADYFLRFAPPTTQMLYADLNLEYEALQSIINLEISAKPIYYDPDKRVLITSFIPNKHHSVYLSDPLIRKEVFTLLHKIENSDIQISRTFEPYSYTKDLANKAKTLPDEFYKSFLPILKRIDVVLCKNPKKSLCHLDLHSKNIIKGMDHLWIVDWEYAMMSHPVLVLASMASIERWNDDEMHTLLNDYFETPSEEDFYRLYLYRIAIDLFWAAWNDVQTHISPLDNPYASWGKLFYAAASDRIHSQQMLDALNYLDNPKVTLLFGPPGSGKGTLAQFAKEKGCAHISAGDLIREEIHKQTETGKAIEDTVKRGEFIEPNLMFQLLKNRANDFVKAGTPFIIDGYGRSVADMQKLEEFLNEIHAQTHVIFLDASDITCQKRISTRLICPLCESVCNETMGYHNNDLCPNCHKSPLQPRLNDNREVTNKRLTHYRQALEQPLRDFFATYPITSYNTDCNLDTCLAHYETLILSTAPPLQSPSL